MSFIAGRPQVGQVFEGAAGPDTRLLVACTRSNGVRILSLLDTEFPVGGLGRPKRFR